MARSWQALHRWWIASSFGCGTTLPVGLMKPCGTSDWRTVWPVVRGVVGFVWETKDVVIAVWWPRHTSQRHRLWKGVLVWPGSSICIGKWIHPVWRRGWRQRRCLFVPRGFYCTRSRWSRLQSSLTMHEPHHGRWRSVAFVYHEGRSIPAIGYFRD